MEWFGLTIYGCPDPIKDMMRSDYKEPEVQPDILEVLAKGSKKSFSELVAELDCYIGRADGNAYKSYDRLMKMRRKGIPKPHGTSTLQKESTNSLDFNFGLRMEWFGLTYYGYPDPIKEVMRPDYKEPEVQLGLFELIAKGTKKSFSELASQLDCCIGRADGYIYKSYDRLIRMRRKGIFKPVGPTEMYKYPATEAMKAGFWRDDPALKNEDWFKQRVYEPKPSTDVTKYVDEAKKVDKFFTL